MTATKPLVGAAAMTAASTLRAVIQVAVLPVIGRILGAHAYGQMALVAPFVFFAMVLAESSLGTCIVRAKNVTAELCGTVFCFSASLALVFILIFATLANPLGRLLGEPLFAPLLLGMSSILLLAALHVVPAALLVRDKRYHWLALSDLISTFGSVVAVAVGIALGWGVWSLVAQQVVLWLCKATVVTLGARSRPRFVFRWRILRDNVTFGSHLTASTIVAFAARNIDNVLIGVFLGVETLGYYALAFQVIGLPTMIIGGSIYYTVFSATSEASRDGGAAPDHFLKGWRGVLLFTVPAMIGLAVTAPLLIPLVLGQKWLPAVPLLIALAPLGLCQAFDSVASGVILGAGRSDRMLKYGLFAAVATITAIALGLPFGSVAVAIGVSIAGLMGFVVYFAAAIKECGVGLRRTIRLALDPFVSALLMGVAVMTVEVELPGTIPLILRFAICVILGVITYALILIALFRERLADDFAFLKAAVSRPG